MNSRARHFVSQLFRTHPYHVAGAVLLLMLAIPFHRKVDSQWDNVYLRAAENMQAGVDMYRLQDGYLYPPFMAWLAIPFTHMPQMAARASWYVINVICLALLWRWAWQLAGGVKGQSWSSREHWICILGLACALRYSIDALQNQQTDLVIGALLIGGCMALQGGTGCRPRRGDVPDPYQQGPATRGTPHLVGECIAGICFGLAAGMKCTALLFAPYLLSRGRWQAAGLVVLVAVGVNLLPNLAGPASDGGWWLQDWTSRYLALMTRENHAPGVWGSAALLNQSLSGAAYRWLMTDWSWTAAGFEVITRSEAISPRAMKWLVYGFEAALMFVMLVVIGRPGSGRASLLPSHFPSPIVLECCIVLLLMVLLSPMSSKPHFCTLMLPAFCLARRAVAERDRLAAACLGAAILAGSLSIRDLAGRELASMFMWYGGVTWSAVFLLVGCSHTLMRQRAGMALSVRLEDQPLFMESRGNAA